jgi:hypothetical protein
MKKKEIYELLKAVELIKQDLINNLNGGGPNNTCKIQCKHEVDKEQCEIDCNDKK